MALDQAGALPFKSDYKGATYYFCSQQCKQKFDQNPERYIKQPRGASLVPRQPVPPQNPTPGLTGKQPLNPPPGNKSAVCPPAPGAGEHKHD